MSVSERKNVPDMENKLFDPKSLREATYELLIHNLKLGAVEYREIRSAADQVQVEYAGRFLVELLQNASDAAQRARLTNSLVKIIRTDSAIYVANQGAPIDTDGLHCICSLGLTTKDAATYVGNKGVGFKSVLDVTWSPEIFSDPIKPGIEFRYAFKLDRHIHGRLRQELRTFANAFIERDAATRDALCQKCGHDRLLDFIEEEFQKCAYFKLPEDVDVKEQADKDEQLCDLITDPIGFATIVKLPLKDDGKARDYVSNAFAQFVKEKGLTILFTPSVAVIDVVDKTEGNNSFQIVKKDIEATDSSAADQGIRIRRCTTTFQRHGQKPERSQWLVAETKLGVEKRPDAPAERQRIAELVKDFPESWRGLQEAEIAVAMPVLPLTDLAIRGQYFLTFASNDHTSFPFHVNGKFFGKLARTGVERTANEYNKYLARQAAHLAEHLSSYMRRVPFLHQRRLACLIYWHRRELEIEGDLDPLAQELLNGLGDKRIILA